MDAHELIDRVTDWSRRDDRVIASAVCGSYARGDARSDSDIDFCILTEDPDALLRDRSWIAGLGPAPSISDNVEDYGLVQSIRVFYEQTEAEFGVTAKDWAEPPIDANTAGVINNGLLILYDPFGRLETARALAAISAKRRPHEESSNV